MRVSYHCPMSLTEYLELPRWDRFEINQQLDNLIERLNDAGDEPPRPMRRGG